MVIYLSVPQNAFLFTVDHADRWWNDKVELRNIASIHMEIAILFLSATFFSMIFCDMCANHLILGVKQYRSMP